MPVVALATHHVVADLKGCFRSVRAELVRETIGRVLLVARMVRIDAHLAVEIERRIRLRHERAIHRNLVQIDADAVVLRIAVEEHAELEEGVGRVFDAGDHAAGRESGLFDVAVEVLRVLVEHQAAEFLHGELLARPDLCHVEGIEAELVWVGILGLHHLDVRSPYNLLSVFNDFVKIALRVVRILAAHLRCLLLGELLLAVLGDEVILDVDKLSFLVDPLEGVATVAVIEAPSLGCAMIAEEHETSVIALGSVSEQVEDAIIVEEEVLGVSMLRTNDVWALDGVTAEEYGEIEADKIVVSLLSVKFDGKTTGVASFIWILTARRDGAKTDEDGGLFPYSLQEFGLGEVGDVFGSLEVPKGTRATGVHHALEVLRAIERLLLLEEEYIGSQRNASNRLAVFGIRPWDAFIVSEVCAVVLTFAASDGS